jgi:hypothetical protein
MSYIGNKPVDSKVYLPGKYYFKVEEVTFGDNFGKEGFNIKFHCFPNPKVNEYTTVYDTLDIEGEYTSKTDSFLIACGYYNDKGLPEIDPSTQTQELVGKTGICLLEPKPNKEGRLRIKFGGYYNMEGQSPTEILSKSEPKKLAQRLSQMENKVNAPSQPKASAAKDEPATEKPAVNQEVDEEDLPF